MFDGLSRPFDSVALERDGYAITPPLVGGETLAELCLAAERAFAGQKKAGLRNALSLNDAFRQIAASNVVRQCVEPILGPAASVVRSILFDKNPAANWDVVWHQDVTIAVAEKIEIAGFGPWSLKDGGPHVQPPSGVLEQMLTVRLHLDTCQHDNGPLLVVPGSHRQGVIDIRTLDPADCDRRAVVCAIEAGGVVLIRPLTLHASKKAAMPKHRRVLHLEFAATELPDPLRWARS